MPQYPHWEQHNNESGHKPFPRFALPHVPMTEGEGLKGSAFGTGNIAGNLMVTGLAGFVAPLGEAGVIAMGVPIMLTSTQFQNCSGIPLPSGGTLVQSDKDAWSKK
jgi:hypothetical protein